MPYKDAARQKEYNRDYAESHRKAAALRAQKWAQDNPEKYRGYHARYYAEHRERILAQMRDYRSEHAEEMRARDASRAWIKAERWRTLKLEAFNAYGGPRCACCGETLFDGLTIDHVSGDGASHRRETGESTPYRWLKKNGYPPGYQVLCGTCNMAKGTSDHCPHEDQRIAWG